MFHSLLHFHICTSYETRYLQKDLKNEKFVIENEKKEGHIKKPPIWRDKSVTG